MKISLIPPGGQRPSIEDHLLKENEATRAVNVRLESGGLRTWLPYLIEEVLDEGGTEYKTIYEYQGSWLTWEEDVDVVRGPLADDQYDRIYFTGTDKPRIMSKDSSPASFPLGVPKPAAAPTLTKSGGAGSDPVTYYYCWTYISNFGEEGAPSAYSSISGVTDTEVVNIDAFPAQTAGRNLAGFRLYRLSDDITGEFFFVQEFEYDSNGDVLDPSAPLSTITNWDDDVTDANLGESLKTDEWDEPPEDMIGIINLPGGFMAGFDGQTVHFSEPWYPHAWPYSISVPYDIVGLGVSGSTLVILTDKIPYLASGGHPESISLMSTSKLFPCRSKRSVVQAEGGVIYASSEGLVFGGSGRDSFYLITNDVVDRIAWKMFYPSTIHGLFYNKKYFGFYSGATQKGGFVIDFEQANIKLTELDFYVLASFEELSDNTAYFVIKNSLGETLLIHWEQGYSQGQFSYLWASKLFLFPKGVNFAAARITADWQAVLSESEVEAINKDAIDNMTVQGAISTYQIGGLPLGSTSLTPMPVEGPIRLTIYEDDEEVFSQDIYKDRIIRLPAGMKYKRFKYQLEGCTLIRDFEIGTSVASLR